MRLAWLAVLCVVFACSDERGGNDSGVQPTTTVGVDTGAHGSSGEGDEATTTGSDGAGSGGDGTTSSPTTGPATTTSDGSSGGMDDGTSSGGGLDCTAPTDCETCFTCAVTQGPCMAGYDACANEAFCSPSLVCVQWMCTEDGLMQSCVDTCCMSCTDLGTCGQVDPVVQCAQAQCAELCGPVTCP